MHDKNAKLFFEKCQEFQTSNRTLNQMWALLRMGTMELLWLQPFHLMKPSLQVQRDGGQGYFQGAVRSRCPESGVCVVSNSLQPRGLQPTGLLCPWDFPGKNTGVGCHFLLQGIFPAQELNLCLLNWQVDSIPLSHLGKSLYSLNSI